jgi:hypothetical protein
MGSRIRLLAPFLPYAAISVVHVIALFAASPVAAPTKLALMPALALAVIWAAALPVGAGAAPVGAGDAPGGLVTPPTAAAAPSAGASASASDAAARSCCWSRRSSAPGSATEPQPSSRCSTTSCR